MYPHWLSAASFLFITALSCTICTTATAQSVSSEQAKLANIEQQLTALQTRQQQLQASLNEKKAQLQPMLKQEPPGKSDLDTALRNLDKAKAAYQTTPTAENKSVLKNIEFKLALAERKYKKANAQRFTLEKEIAELSAQLTASGNEASLLTSSISKQLLAVNKARSQQQAKELARREQEQKLKAEADAAEIARLKAQLEKREKAEKARIAAAALAAEVPEAKAPATKAPAIPTTGLVAQTPATTPPPTPSPAATANDESSTDNSHAILLTTKDQLKAEEQRIKALLASPGKRKSSYRNAILYLKAVTSSGTTRKSRPYTLRPLGHNQYRGKARLGPGKKITFAIGRYTWSQKTPVISKGSTKYTFLFDGTDSKQPRLVYYPSSLSQ